MLIKLLPKIIKKWKKCHIYKEKEHIFRKICSKSIPYSSFIPSSSIPYSELKFATPSVFKTQERRTQQPSNWLTFLCSKLHEPTLRKIFQTSVLTIILFDKAPFGRKKGTLCKFSIKCKLKRPLLLY